MIIQVKVESILLVESVKNIFHFTISIRSKL